MSSLPRYSSLVGHRVPVEIANDPPFRFLVEAYEGRSRIAIRNEQKSSSCKARQQFLNLVRGKVPKSDIRILVATIDAAVLHYDRIPDIGEADYTFLGDLLRFLWEFGLVEERTYAPVAEEVKSRIHIKAGTFDSYLFEWDQKTQRESFETEAIKAAEVAERMHANKKQAHERLAVRRREQQAEQDAGRRPPLKEELHEREPVPEDLRRLCPEERSLVHSLKDVGNQPVNWIALAGETFRNQLTREDYEKLAELERRTEQDECYHTPPGSPMHE
jgi:hypothetical protein